MAVRNFPDGAGITFAPGNAAALPTGAWTIAVIAKPAVLSSFQVMVAVGHGIQDLGLWITSSGGVQAVLNGFGRPIALPLVENEWFLIAITKTSGIAIPRGHAYRYSTGTWTHLDATDTLESKVSVSLIELGRTNNDWFYVGNMAVAGVWNVALSDAQIETLETSLQSWLDSGVVAVWPLNQDSVATPVQDVTGGGADQIAESGTAVVMDDVPPFFFEQRTAPTFVAEYEAAWNTSTTPKNVAVSVNNGDALVILGGAENEHAQLATPSGGGLAYTLKESIVLTDFSSAQVYTTIATSTQSFTLSVAKQGQGSLVWGYNAFRFSGTEGIGASAQTTGTGTPTVDIITTKENSAIAVIVLDWNAADGATRTWLPVNGIGATEQSYFHDAARYTVYAAYYPDVGAAGLKTVGLSAPTGLKYSIIAVEVLGIASGGGGAPVTVPVNVAAETSTAFAVAKRKAKIVTNSIENSIALAVDRLVLKSFGFATEISDAFAIDSQKRRSVGLATEMNLAFPIASSARKFISIATTVETNTAFFVARSKSYQINTAHEVDLAFPIISSSARLVLVSTAIETETALAFARNKIYQIGLARETNLAFLITLPGKTLVIPSPVEVNIISPARSVDISPVVEVLIWGDEAFMNL